jgi:predicted nucleic acid-binding protein
MAWCFGDESDAFTDLTLERCRKESALVPGLWTLEVINVLLVAERRSRIEPADSARFIELLRGLPIEVQWGPQLNEDSMRFDVARRHRLSSYDAAYIALAMRRGVPLATNDDRLARAASTEGVELVRADSESGS